MDASVLTFSKDDSKSLRSDSDEVDIIVLRSYRKEEVILN